MMTYYINPDATQAEVDIFREVGFSLVDVEG